MLGRSLSSAVASPRQFEAPLLILQELGMAVGVGDDLTVAMADGILPGLIVGMRPPRAPGSGVGEPGAGGTEGRPLVAVVPVVGQRADGIRQHEGVAGILQRRVVAQAKAGADEEF